MHRSAGSPGVWSRTMCTWPTDNWIGATTPPPSPLHQTGRGTWRAVGQVTRWEGEHMLRGTYQLVGVLRQPLHSAGIAADQGHDLALEGERGGVEGVVGGGREGGAADQTKPRCDATPLARAASSKASPQTGTHGHIQAHTQAHTRMYAAHTRTHAHTHAHARTFTRIHTRSSNGSYIRTHKTQAHLGHVVAHPQALCVQHGREAGLDLDQGTCTYPWYAATRHWFGHADVQSREEARV
jgi:hypothetical protein